MIQHDTEVQYIQHTRIDVHKYSFI